MNPANYAALTGGETRMTASPRTKTIGKCRLTVCEIAMSHEIKLVSDWSYRICCPFHGSVLPPLISSADFDTVKLTFCVC